MFHVRARFVSTDAMHLTKGMLCAMRT